MAHELKIRNGLSLDFTPADDDLNGVFLLKSSSGTVSKLANIPASKITAPGSNTQVLFNDAGNPGAHSGFVYSKTTGLLTVGAGTPVSNGKYLTVVNSQGTDAASVAVQVTARQSTTLTGATITALSSYVQSDNAAGTVAQMVGHNSNAVNAGNGNVTTIKTYQANNVVASSGTITDFISYSANLTFSVAGTITNYYGLKVDAPIGAGTITNRWGVYVGDTTAFNYFGGRVGIGLTSPTTILHIRAAAPEIRLDANTGGEAYLEFAENDSRSAGEYWHLYKSTGTHELRFYNGTDRVRLSPTGEFVVVNKITAGAGTAINTGSVLTTSFNSASASGNEYGGTFNFTQSAATTGTKVGVYSYVKGTHTSGTVATMYGISGHVQAAGSGGTTTVAIGVFGSLTSAGGANITQAYGGYFQAVDITSGAGVVTHSYGVYIAAAVVGGGTITNRWALYSDDILAQSHFASNVGIGTTSISAKLHVVGLNNNTALLVTDDAGNAIINAGESGGARVLGLFGVTPATRPTAAIVAAAFVANSSGIADDTATWGGYTAGQVVAALKVLGILT